MSCVKPPDLNPQATNGKLSDECIQFIKQCICAKNAEMMTATPALREASEKIPASDLKIPDHFKNLTMTERNVPADLVTEVESYLQESKRLCKRGLIPAIAKCEADVLENLSILKSGIKNEAELRFAVADPILRLLCSYWGLKVCGEVWGNYVSCRVLN